MSRFETVLVERYFIGDDDEGIHEADNPASFDDTDALLEKLRSENPTVNYTMCAAIDA